MKLLNFGAGIQFWKGSALSDSTQHQGFKASAKTGWHSSQIAPFVVFLVVFIFLFWLVGHCLTFANIDEGIYLDAGKRVASGQAPYRDFFYLSGPGTPWALGFSMKLFGANLPAAQLTVIFDLSLIATLVFWMTRKLGATMSAALFAEFIFVAFSTAQPSVLVVNHRWDSAAMGLAAIVLTWRCREQPRRFFSILAGLACAVASWMTPPVGLVAITISLWFVFDKNLRPMAASFFSGAGAGLTAGVILLQSKSALFPMIRQMFWLTRNYSDANRMAYGQVIGGYRSMIDGVSGIELVGVFFVLFFLTLPAWLPPAITLGWLLRLRRTWMSAENKRFEIPFLLVCGAVFILAQMPKLDLGHLTYTVPIYWALAVALASEASISRLATAITVVFLGAGLVSISFTILNRMKEVPTVTYAGVASMNPEQSGWLRVLTEHINRQDSLFVFPYMPALYFALDAQNPTKYSFLQPGMSTQSDEANVLTALRRNPPKWVIDMNLKPHAYLRIWPSSDHSRLRMRSIEQFIESGYVDICQAGPYKIKKYHWQGN